MNQTTIQVESNIAVSNAWGGGEGTARLIHRACVFSGRACSSNGTDECLAILPAADRNAKYARARRNHQT